MTTTNQKSAAAIMDTPDSELMARLAAGEDLALNSLMDRWSSRVMAFLYRMTGQRETAADLAQETFVKLYQARSRYRPQGKFSTWIFTIAANLARNHNRWKSRHPTVSIHATDSDGAETFPETVAPDQTPEESAKARETAAAVDQAILSLPIELRESLTLFVYEDLAYTEIATLSHCTPKAVETRIYRARQLLKEKLKDLRA